MGGTSIEASLERRRPVQPFGEWNAGADRRRLTRCWVLRERATDPSRPTPERFMRSGVSVGAWSADGLPGEPGKHRSRPGTRP